MFSFLANKETEHTDPVLFSSDHCPETIPQTRGIPHGTRQSVPRLIDGIHIPSPNIDQVVQSCIIQRHVVRPAIQLVLMESNKASMVNQVVDRQPLLKDVAEVLLRVLRLEQCRIDDLKPVTTTLTRRSVISSRTSLVIGYFSPSENVVRAVFSILVKRGLPM